VEGQTYATAIECSQIGSMLPFCAQLALSRIN